MVDVLFGWLGSSGRLNPGISRVASASVEPSHWNASPSTRPSGRGEGARGPTLGRSFRNLERIRRKSNFQPPQSPPDTPSWAQAAFFLGAGNPVRRPKSDGAAIILFGREHRADD